MKNKRKPPPIRLLKRERHTLCGVTFDFSQPSPCLSQPLPSATSSYSRHWQLKSAVLPMVSTCSTNQIIFLGPSLATLESSKAIRAKPVYRSSLVPLSQQSAGQKTIVYRSEETLLPGKRGRTFQHPSSRDATELDSPPLKRPRRTPENRATHGEVTLLDAMTEPGMTRPDSIIAGHDTSSDHDKDNSQHLSCTLRERSDAEADYRQCDDDDLVQVDSDSRSIIETTGPVVQPISKAERLRLGPARVVGMTRKVHKKAPLLKAMERPRLLAAEREIRERDFILPVSEHTFEVGSINLQAASQSLLGGATTVESIPPPPTHAFSLSHLTPISRLLSSPNSFLSSYQGGNQQEGAAVKFNILALVTRVGGLEDAPDWKKGAGKRMDRCEIVVKDASECQIKVVLESDCATNWATPRDDEPSFGQVYTMDGNADESQSSSDVYSNSHDTSLLAAQDDCTTTASRTTIEGQRNDRMLPLRPGDVVVLSRLYLFRPRLSKARPSFRSNDTKALSTHAIASPSSGATLELCWRSSIQRSFDQRRNFDKCLTAFDARCRAIFHLAQSWTASE